MADNNLRSDRGRDPIAELARLIAQAHAHRESAPADNGFREENASDGCDEPPEFPPAPQLPGYMNAPERSYGIVEHRHDDGAYDADDQLSATDEFQNKAPRLHRRSLALVMAICGLALLGTAGAFSYRNVFGSSVPPSIKASNELNRLTPASSEPPAKNSGNARQASTATTGSIENTISREGQPAVVGTTAAPNRALLAADPVALAAASSSREVAPPVLDGGYAVQVTSERSESRAQAAFQALQAKYPNQLGGRQLTIRRADLGAAGTYYRALVGPFASAEKAAKLCSGLKAAGGNCIIQKN